MADDLNIEITVGIDKALKEIKKLTKSISQTAVKAVGRLSKAIGSMGRAINKTFRGAINAVKAFGRALTSTKALVGTVIAALAGRAFIGAIGAVTDAAAEQEDAVKSLNTAMKLTGEFSKDASDEMQDFASALQDTTVFGDEAILKTLALAKAFGATNKQAKDVTTAAIELSAATGKSLEESTRQVSKTLGGFAGELGEVNPAIKALTSDQLKAGDAAKILIAQYGGSAAAQIDTFSGAVQQTKNSFGDLLEQIGFVITKNPVVIAAIKGLGSVFKDLIKFISDNQTAISRFVGKSVIFLIKSFGGLVKSIANATIAIASFVKAGLKIPLIGDAVGGLFTVFNNLELVVTNAFEKILDGINVLLITINELPGVGGKFDPLIIKIENLRSSVAEVTDELAEGFEQVSVDPAVEGLQIVEDAAKATKDAVLETTDSLTEELEKLQNKPIEVKVAPAPAAGGGGSQDEEEIVSLASFDEFGQNLKESITKALDTPNLGLKLGAQISKGILGGAKGAQALLSKGLVAGANGLTEALAPGASKFLGPVFETLIPTLLGGPEATKALVEGFVQAVPVLLDGFAQAAPVLVTAIAENIDEIVIALIKATPAIARALAIEVPRALLTANWGAVAGNLASAFIEEVTGQSNVVFDPEKARKMFEPVTKIFEDAADALAAPLEAFENFLDQFDWPEIPTPERPQVGGAAGQAGRSFATEFERATGVPLQSGGTVPAGFPDDSFAASLTSGELVVPRNDVEDLRSFLRGQENGTDLTETNALLAQLIEMGGTSGPVEVSISEDGLSDAILNANIRNERLSA